MKKSVIVNKGSSGKASGTLDLVDGGFIKNYGGCVAIGYKSGNKERFLSVALEDMQSFIRDVTDRCKEAEKVANGKCRGYQRSRFDDEPIDKCKECKEFELYEEE